MNWIFGALLSAILSLDPDARSKACCKFQTRCRFTIDICRTEEPKLEHSGSEYDVACHRWEELTDETSLTA